ncbi:MAG: hypothetical protein D6815_12935 [Candidatus Dadabacteria bacterium]|nr:MAG: hypothetical protein D6815_12935 [Candidatus Dadabacteria bacterium]
MLRPKSGGIRFGAEGAPFWLDIADPYLIIDREHTYARKGEVYVTATHSATGAILTTTIEHAPAGNQGCSEHYSARIAGNMAGLIQQTRRRTFGELELFEYTVPEFTDPQGTTYRIDQRHFIGCAERGGYVAYVHLSKMHFSAEQEPFLEFILSSVHLIPREDGSGTSKRLFPVLGDGYIGLIVPETWRTAVIGAGGTTAPAIDLWPYDREDGHLYISVAPSAIPPPEDMPARAVAEIEKELRPKVVEESIERGRLDGPEIHGAYVSATYQKPLKEHCRRVVEGAALLAGIPVRFTVRIKDPASQFATQAFDVIKSIHVVERGRKAGPGEQLHYTGRCKLPWS